MRQWILWWHLKPTSIFTDGVRCTLRVSGVDRMSSLASDLRAIWEENSHFEDRRVCVCTIHDVMLGTGKKTKQQTNTTIWMKYLIIYRFIWEHTGRYKRAKTKHNRDCVYIFGRSVRSTWTAADFAYEVFLKMKLIFSIQMIVWVWATPETLHLEVPKICISPHPFEITVSLKWEIKREKRKPALFLCVSMLHESLSSNFNQCVETWS